MSFTSYSFILLMLPISLLLYYMFREKGRIQSLIIAAGSVVFLALGSIQSLLVCLLSTIVNYFGSRKMASTPPQTDSELKRYRALFWTLVVLNVALLVSYKYFIPAGYFPLGLSFYTFSQLLYLKSVYVEGKSVPDFLSYLNWTVFFGKIAQGPITNYAEIEEFRAREHRIDWDLLADGVVLFVLGMAKKLLLADNLAVIVDNAWSSTDIGLLPAWVGTLSYTFQLYFDFSGYTDMAMGVGMMFGIRLPQNFNSPYKSSSVSEFWRRWHITLGRALTQLVYIPLGGNRKGTARTCVNLLVVMLVSGIWHGNTYTFVIWGLLNGIIMVIERLTGLSKRKSKIQTFVTFFIVNFLWVFFRAPGLESAFAMLASMFDFDNLNFGGIGSLGMDGIIGFPSIIWTAYIFMLLLISVLVVFVARKNSTEVYSNIKKMKSSLIFIPLLFVMAFVCLNRGAVFLYQNF